MDPWSGHQQDFLGYLQGDTAATRRVFTAITKALRGYYFARTRDPALAEDLCQAALLKIHFARDRFDPGLSLKTWVFTIAGRVLIDHWRGLREGEELDEAALPEAAADLGLAERLEAGPDLEKALAVLKPNDRSIVYMSVVEGFSMAEIAQALGGTEGAVKVRAHRAYQQMRKVLQS